jgi:flagellar assembly factor FliW
MPESGRTVQVQSKRFGTLDIPADRIFELPEGLIGLPSKKRFVLLDHRPGSPFKWMLSIDDPELAFAVADPADLVPGYVAPMEKISTALSADPTDLVVFALMRIPSDPTQMTINLLAPVAVDLRSRIGRQMVLEDPRFDAAHRIVPEPKAAPPADKPGKP